VTANISFLEICYAGVAWTHLAQATCDLWAVDYFRTADAN